MADEPNLFAQYPLQCQVIKNVANGRDFKTMAYRGYWRTDRGNHQVIRPARAISYIGGKGRGGGEDLFHLTPYSKFQDLYHYQCAGHDDDLLCLLEGWQGAGLLCWAGQEDPHASGTGLWSATRHLPECVASGVWAAHFTLARHVICLIEGPSRV